MELTTDRLVLREFSLADHASVHAFAADPAVVRYVMWGPNSAADTTKFLADAIETGRSASRLRYPLAITRDGALIGSIELQVAGGEEGSIGYALASSSWGHGYATEAAAALLQFGFALGLCRISATCDPENVGSARVLAKIGLRQVGHLKGAAIVRGEWRDRLLFTTTAPPG